MLALPQDFESASILDASPLSDLRLSARKLSGSKRRAFQAEMTIKYFNGSARLAESRTGWNRSSVAMGLGERRTGVICIGAQSAFWGNKRWEEHRHCARAWQLSVIRA
jgi:hypothetical protein